MILQYRVVVTRVSNLPLLKWFLCINFLALFILIVTFFLNFNWMGLFIDNIFLVLIIVAGSKLGARRLFIYLAKVSILLYSLSVKNKWLEVKILIYRFIWKTAELTLWDRNIPLILRSGFLVIKPFRPLLCIEIPILIAILSSLLWLWNQLPNLFLTTSAETLLGEPILPGKMIIAASSLIILHLFLLQVFLQAIFWNVLKAITTTVLHILSN